MVLGSGEDTLRVSGITLSRSRIRDEGKVNAIIAIVVGAVLAGAATFGGVSAFQGGDQKPVDNSKLYSYADQ